MKQLITAGAAVLGFGLMCAAPVGAQGPDTVLINGKILTVDGQFSTREALAVRDGKIAAIGTTADIRKLAGPRTRVIDLQGRTVIPGLIDSHLHALRAGQTFATEVNWAGVRSLTEALARISEAARARPPGAWLVVAGGWNVMQFRERRRPTQAELVAAAPNNPAYVQLGYDWAMLNPAAHKALNIKTEADLPAGGKFEKDAGGQPTGAIVGGIVPLFDRLPKPTLDQQVEGTKKFFREMNRLGLTGADDPGGNNMTPNEYQAVLKLWRQGGMTVRIAYSLSGYTPGSEVEELKSATVMLPGRFGDDMLRFNGLGERITDAILTRPDNVTEAEKQKFYELLKYAADRGMAVNVHWVNDDNVDLLLTMIERLNKEVPIAPLRWSVTHLNNASVKSLQRMKALGMGWTVQDGAFFGGEEALKRNPEAARRQPPLNTALKIGLPIGAGTDAHRAMWYQPFTALQWLLDGKTVTGVTVRGPEETPNREDALRFYTVGSAWFSYDDDKRGSLEVGKLADLAVLTKDYMTVPVDQVGGLESLLTMVGGKVVYAAGPYKRLEEVR